MSDDCGNKAAYRKAFALVEIIAAMIFCLVEIVGCVRLSGSISDLSGSAAGAVESYIIVVDHSREVFCDTYRTIPQHKKTIEEICSCLNSMGRVCRNTSAAIPEWKWLAAVKQFPLNLYRPFGELERSLDASLTVLDTLDEKKYRDIITAFDGTRTSLEAAGATIPELRGQLTHTIFFITAFMVFIALLVLWHGAVSLSVCGAGKNATDI